MKMLLVVTVLLSACSPEQKGIPDKQLLLGSLDALTATHDGWQFMNESGGGSAGSREIHARIILNGKTYGQAMNEMQTLMTSSLKSSGVSIIGGGESSSGSGLTGFSVSVQTPDSIGTIVVSSASVDSSTLVLAIAVSQLTKP